MKAAVTEIQTTAQAVTLTLTVREAQVLKAIMQANERIPRMLDGNIEGADFYEVQNVMSEAFDALFDGLLAAGEPVDEVLA